MTSGRQGLWRDLRAGPGVAKVLLAWVLIDLVGVALYGITAPTGAKGCCW